MRQLPVWIADGAEVSDLAYRIVVLAFSDLTDPPRNPHPIDPVPTIPGMTGRVINHLAEELDADEGEVLRAMAELEHVGAFEKTPT